ncbi:MAG: gamma-glutamyltransferase family protein [Chloroflexota bacterium]
MRTALAGSVAAGKRAAAAAQHPAAAEAAIEAMSLGGTVIDGAVAGAFAAAVADVGRTGLGGYGGHIVYHDSAAGQDWAIDFPSCAPLATRQELFGGQVSSNETGPLAVGVPGTVAGLAIAHQRFGRLPWADVLAPAIRLAWQGIRLPWAGGHAPILDEAKRMTPFPESIRVFVHGWQDDLLVQPDLARSLETLAIEGPAAMYRGSLADAIVSYVRAAGGILNHEDLQRYAATVSPAVRTDYRGMKVVTPGADSGAGVLIPVLNALEGFDVARLDPLGAERLALLAAIFGRVWPDRLALAGSLPTGNPGERLLLPEYAEEVRADVRAGRALVPAPVSSDHCTDHLCVADGQGNVASCTTTLQLLMGSGVTVPGTGILLNNAMRLFEREQGKPNSLAPSKRAITNMCPTIALGPDGRPVLAIGASGGRRIPSMVVQALTLVLDHGWTALEALAAPRFHTEGGPVLTVEEGWPEGTLNGLGGLTVDARPARSLELGGQSPAVAYAGGELLGIPDPRRHGGAAAW